MGEQSSFRKLADLLWPFGVTVLGIIVVPIAIEQYPDFFTENSWILPASTCIVVASWVIPLIVHERAITAVKWLWKTPWVGPLLSIGSIFVVIIVIYIGGQRLINYHRHHLAVALAQKPEHVAPTPSVATQTPQEDSEQKTAPTKNTNRLPPQLKENSDCSHQVGDGPEPYDHVCESVIADYLEKIAGKVKEVTDQDMKELEDNEELPQQQRQSMDAIEFKYSMKFVDCCLKPAMGVYAGAMHRFPWLRRENYEMRIGALLNYGQKTRFVDANMMNDVTNYFTEMATDLRKDSAGKGGEPYIPALNCPAGACVIGTNNATLTVNNNFGAIERHLNADIALQLDDVAVSISSKDSKSVQVFTIETAEAENLADTISEIFFKHGFGFQHAFVGTRWFPNIPMGVLVIVKDQTDPALPLARKIAASLNTNVSPVAIVYDPIIMASGRVAIVIGDKTSGDPVYGSSRTWQLR